MFGYAKYNQEIEGFKGEGKYNPKYLIEIPDEIFVSILYYEVLENKLILRNKE